MREFELCRELSRKLCKDLGATPFSLRKAGLTHPDLQVRGSLRVSDEKGVVEEVPMWYGEVLGVEGLMCCLLAVLDESPESLEVACIIGFKNAHGELEAQAIRAGFRYDWGSDSDEGILIMKVKDQWVGLSLAQRLQLSLGFENMVQEGALWKPAPNVPEEFRKNLSEIIEVDNEA